VKPHASSGRTIGLRHDDRDLVLARHRFEGWNCKERSAEKDDAHRRRCYQVCVFVTGGVSAVVVVTVPDTGGVTGSYGAAVPSAPLLGSGAGCPVPFAGGDSSFF
jgi:hypothetical protein